MLALVNTGYDKVCYQEFFQFMFQEQARPTLVPGVGMLKAFRNVQRIALVHGGVIFFGLFFWGGGSCFSSFLGTGGMDMGLGLHPRARGGDPRAGAGIPTRIYTSVHLQLL